jgi:hypothetical protein
MNPPAAYTLLVLALFASQTQALFRTDSRSNPELPNLEAFTYYEVVESGLLLEGVNADLAAQAAAGTITHPTRIPFEQAIGGHPVHRHFVSLVMSAFGDVMTLDLEVNLHLLAARFHVREGHGDEERVTQVGAENCYYTGYVRGRKADSSVSIDTCAGGVDGVIYVNGDTYFIQPTSMHTEFAQVTQLQSINANKLQTLTMSRSSFTTAAAAPHGGNANNGGADLNLLSLGTHLLYRQSEVKPEFFTERGCGHAHTHANDIVAHALGESTESLEVAPGGRKLLQTAAAKYLELSIYNEQNMVTSHGSVAATQTYVLNILNQVNTLYQRFDGATIVISLVMMTHWNTGNPAAVGAVTAATDITALLGAFRGWTSANNKVGKGTRTGGDVDAAHMFVGLDISGGVAGVAYVGTVCTTGAVGVDENNRGAATGNPVTYNMQTFKVWTAEVITHEMGHNFASSHDSTGNACAPSGQIMAAVGNAGAGRQTSALDWSTCSQTYINGKLQGLSGTTANCLANDPGTSVGAPPVATSTGGGGGTPPPATAVCGDGIVSGTEECDIRVHNVNICNPQCMKQPGVKCVSGTCCTFAGEFVTAGVPCRLDLHQCDLPDYCNGTSAQCPTDRYKADGTVCDEAGPGSRCADGMCLGYGGQCAETFTQYRDYGYWISCMDAPTAQPCGDLICKINGSISDITSATSECYTISIAGGGNEAVQVREKTPCGSGNICVNSLCVAPATGSIPVCPSVGGVACGGRGICTNEAKCLCDPGYTGAYCDQTLNCGADCRLLGRKGCISNSACGECLTGRGTVGGQGDMFINTFCELRAPAAFKIQSTYTVAGSTTSRAFDQQPYTHWVADFTTPPAVLQIQYSTPFELVHYEMMSSNTLPGEDPKSWFVEGSTIGFSGPWTILDQQTGILFTERHMTKAFPLAVDRIQRYTYFQMRFTQARDDAQTQSPTKQLQVAEIIFYDRLQNTGIWGLLGASSTLQPSVGILAAVALTLAYLAQ